MPPHLLYPKNTKISVTDSNKTLSFGTNTDNILVMRFNLSIQHLKKAATSHIYQHRIGLLRGFAHAAAIGIVLSFIAWNCLDSLGYKSVNKKHDAYHQVKYAYHLVHEGAFTRVIETDGTPRRDAYREPLFAVYMALGIFLNGSQHSASLEDLVRGHSAHRLRRWQVPVLLATALLVFLVVRRMARRYWLSYGAMSLVGLSFTLNHSVAALTTEHHAAFWTLAVSFLIFLCVRSHRRWCCIATGCCMGILVLNKASFMFLIWPLLLFLFLVGKNKGVTTKTLLINLAILLLCYLIPVGGWMVRNYGQYGTFFLTHRAGNILAIREAYNRMSDEEFAGAFLYWTPDPGAIKKMKEEFGENATQEGGALQNLNRSNDKSYYRRGRHVRNKILKEHGEETPYTDSLVREIAMSRIKNHPLKHLRAMLPLGWRSVFIESGFGFHMPLTLEITDSAAVSLILLAAFIGSVILGIIRKRWDWIGFVLPSSYLLCLNVAASHCLPRYNFPLIPIFVIATLLVVSLQKTTINS